MTSDQLATPLDDVAAMRLALDAARDAGRAGDVPVGAVALHDGSLLAVAGNARERRHDPTAHAELEVLRAAAAALSTWRLDDVTVVVTLEPCAMCAGALVAARIGRLVLGALDTKAGAARLALQPVCGPPPQPRGRGPYGVLEAECAEVLRTFFAERRAP